MKKKSRIITVLSTVIFTAVFILSILPPHTPVIKNPNGVSEIKKIDINGVEQYLLVRGVDQRNPVILFIHGGPGQAEIGYIRKAQEELEKDFVVVRWDQRGAGLSASKKAFEGGLSLDGFVSDADAVTDFIRRNYGKERIYLAGHSWGSIVGISAAAKHPEKYLAYIGVSQFSDINKSEELSYDYALAEAERLGNAEVIEKLKRIGRPPYGTAGVTVRAECLSRLGCIYKTEPEINLMKELLGSSEYNMRTKISYMKNGLKSSRMLMPEILSADLTGRIKSMEIPIYFLSGKYDYFTPMDTAKEFLDGIRAPYKRFYTFENSAHLPHLEEPELFNSILKEILSGQR